MFLTYVEPSFYWRCVNYSVVLAWSSGGCTPCRYCASQQAARNLVLRRRDDDLCRALRRAGRVLPVGRAAGRGFFPSERFRPDDVSRHSVAGHRLSVFSLIMIVNRRLHRDVEDDIKRRLEVEALMQLNLDRSCALH